MPGGNFVTGGATPNDGQEVLAYMPGSMPGERSALPSAAGGCTNDANTADRWCKASMA